MSPWHISNQDMVSLTLAEQDCHMVWGLAAILAVSMWPAPRNCFLLRALPRSRAWMSFPLKLHPHSMVLIISFHPNIMSTFLLEMR